jgi:hypothetical protein
MFTPRNEWPRLKPWWHAFWHAAPLTAWVLGLLHHWFAVADRYVVFLYNHDMGPLYPDTSPFSVVTSSRYWMAGLVASGAVMVGYTAANALWARLAAAYRPPLWWRVWACCALPLLIGIPAITMTANQPTLPLCQAARTTLATLAGLALALLPGKWAAERPLELGLMALDGAGWMMILGASAGFDDLPRWLARGGTPYVRLMVLALAAGLLVLLFASVLWVLGRMPIPGALATLTAGVCVTYLFMPLVHHVLYTDGYYYITDSDNFFARGGLLRMAIAAVTAALAVGLTRLRRSLAARWAVRMTLQPHREEIG